LKQRDRYVVPGGGANAVNNLADLGVNVLPVGVVGDDEPGRLLLKAFRHKRVPVDGILRLKGRTTVTKTRIQAGHSHTSRQQVVRIDKEPEAPLEKHIARELLAGALRYSKAADALLISDYGYGAATPNIFHILREKRGTDSIPVTLDSRYRMLEFQGVTAATPNEDELEEALKIRVGDDVEHLYAAGDALLAKMGLDTLLVTRGKDGMVSFAKGRKPVNLPIHGGDEVADVTGAGDTVIATFTAALAAGAESEDAARLANYAGGIVVMKRGTATVTADELRHAVQHS
jgi:D-glycero-beta-D-manno-heptose-7-phosphate kinase